MASYTSNLNLLKKDAVADAQDTFNIKEMMNENWDKIDLFAGTVNGKLIGGYAWKQVAAYTTAGSFAYTPDFTGDIGVLVIGGGGGGGSMYTTGSNKKSVYGGASGYVCAAGLAVTSGQSYSGTVGAGGTGAVGGTSSTTIYKGSAGGDSSFGGYTAKGGGGGDSDGNYKKDSQKGAAAGCVGDSQWGWSNTWPDFDYYYGDQGSSPWQCFNPFTGEGILAGGAGAYWAGSSAGTRTAGSGGKKPGTTLGGGDGSCVAGANGGNATSAGCGGGSYLAKTAGNGGNGHAGAVIIYRKIVL